MKYALLIFAILLGMAARADIKVSREFNAFSAEQQKELRDIQNKYNLARQKSKDLKAQIAQAEASKTCKDAKTKADLDACAVKFEKIDKDNEEAQRQVSIADDQLERFEKSYNEKTDKYSPTKRAEEIAKNQQAAVDLTKKMDDQDRDATMAFEKLKLNSAVTQFKLGNNKQNIDKMYNQIDRTNMGSYMADRMAKLLNSRAFCDAQKNCAPKSSGPKIRDEDLYDVFTSMKDIRDKKASESQDRRESKGAK